MGGCATLFFVFLGVGIIGQIVTSFERFTNQNTNDSTKNAVTDNREKMRAALDPPSTSPLTPKQHFETAKRLLAKIDPTDYDTTDVLLKLVTEHAEHAKQDTRLRPQTDALMKRVAAKALAAVKNKAWNAPKTKFSAEFQCKQAIESRLKAPSTADWTGPATGLWKDHAGYFLVTYTVDAQNSFGAKLRSSYQCQVVCISEEACEVEKMYSTR